MKVSCLSLKRSDSGVNLSRASGKNHACESGMTSVPARDRVTSRTSLLNSPACAARRTGAFSGAEFTARLFDNSESLTAWRLGGGVRCKAPYPLLLPRLRAGAF